MVRCSPHHTSVYNSYILSTPWFHFHSVLDWPRSCHFWSSSGQLHRPHFEVPEGVWSRLSLLKVPEVFWIDSASYSTGQVQSRYSVTMNNSKSRPKIAAIGPSTLILLQSAWAVFCEMYPSQVVSQYSTQVLLFIVLKKLLGSWLKSWLTIASWSWW